jgi:probable rRNA maturation factor
MRIASKTSAMPAEIVVDEFLATEGLDERKLLAAHLVVVSKFGADKLAGDVCVRICDEASSQELNRTFRQRDKPTNVLSFPADVDVGGELILGDLALCWPIVVSEAKLQEKSTSDHAVHLTVHGLLHLLGFDHEQGSDAEIMEDLEREILASLNIADPYTTQS